MQKPFATQPEFFVTTLVSRIITVNDGSTDDTADVLAKIQINEPRLMAKNLTDNVGFLQAAHIGLSYQV